MGRGRMMGVQTLFELIIPIVMLIGALAVVFYYAILPDIPLRHTKIEQGDQKSIEKVPLGISFLEDEEKKVYEILEDAGGTLLQKEIVWKTGYSKVKVHRIVYRLANRGIIEVEKHFNTNKITLKVYLK